MKRRFQPIVESLEGRVLLAGVTDATPLIAAGPALVADDAYSTAVALPAISFRVEKLETCNSLVCSFDAGRAWYVTRLGGESSWTDTAGEVRFNIAKDATTVLLDVADDLGQPLPPLRVDLDGDGNLMGVEWELPRTPTSLPQTVTNSPTGLTSLHSAHGGFSETASSDAIDAAHGDAHFGANVVSHSEHGVGDEATSASVMSRHLLSTTDRNSTGLAGAIALSLGLASGGATPNENGNADRAAEHGSDMSASDADAGSSIKQSSRGESNGAVASGTMSHEGGEENATYDTVLSEWSGGERKTQPATSLLARWVAAAATADVAARTPVGTHDGAVAVAMADFANSAGSLDPSNLVHPAAGLLDASDSTDVVDAGDLADSDVDANWVFVGASTLAAASLAGIYQLEHRRRKNAATAITPAAPERLTTFVKIAPSR